MQHCIYKRVKFIQKCKFAIHLVSRSAVFVLYFTEYHPKGCPFILQSGPFVQIINSLVGCHSSLDSLNEMHDLIVNPISKLLDSVVSFRFDIWRRCHMQ